jgi:hypothetical protein
MIGKELSSILEEIEFKLLEYETFIGKPPKYTKNGFRAAIKIFSSAILDSVWNLQESEELSIDDRLKMVESLGNKIRELVKVYTNIDTKKLYDN